MNKNATLSAIEQIIPLLSGFVYLLDKDGVYYCCTPMQALLFGLNSHHEIFGKTNQTLPFFEKQLALRKKLDIVQKKTIKNGLTVPYKLSIQESIFIDYYKIPIFDKKKRIVGLVGLSFDKVDTQSLLKMLAKQAQTEIAFQNIIANLPGHVYWKDKDGKYLGCNLLQAKDLNFDSISEVIGKTDYDLSPLDKAEAIRQTDLKIMLEGRSIETEEIVVKNDQNVIVLSHKSPLYDNNKNIVGVLGISFDISKRKATEKALKEAKIAVEKADKAKAEFLRNMEHQLRTPFSGVYSLVSIAAELESDPELKELLDTTYHSGEELLRLINDIIDFSRNEIDSSIVLSKKFDLKQLIEKAIILEKPAAIIKQLELIYNYPNELPTVFISDPGRIQGILLHLLSNAIKFTSSGSIHVEIKLGKQIDEKNYIIQIIVTDTGIGISEEHQALIYEQFYRVSPANQNKYSGAGLGLSTVKRLVEDLNGEIDVVSKLAQGTTFICTLSLKRPLLDEPIIEETNSKEYYLFLDKEK